MKTYLTCEEVMGILGVGKTVAYGVIKTLNKQLNEKGYITIQGKVSAKYFMEKYYCGEDEIMKCL